MDPRFYILADTKCPGAGDDTCGKLGGLHAVIAIPYIMPKKHVDGNLGHGEIDFGTGSYKTHFRTQGDRQVYSFDIGKPLPVPVADVDISSSSRLAFPPLPVNSPNTSATTPTVTSLQKRKAPEDTTSSKRLKSVTPLGCLVNLLKHYFAKKDGKVAPVLTITGRKYHVEESFLGETQNYLSTTDADFVSLTDAQLTAGADRFSARVDYFDTALKTVLYIHENKPAGDIVLFLSGVLNNLLSPIFGKLNTTNTITIFIVIMDVINSAADITEDMRKVLEPLILKAKQQLEPTATTVSNEEADRILGLVFDGGWISSAGIDIPKMREMPLTTGLIRIGKFIEVPAGFVKFDNGGETLTNEELTMAYLTADDAREEIVVMWNRDLYVYLIRMRIYNMCNLNPYNLQALGVV
ncbi:hypothetical protein JX266_006035 [Neoarthrinium moseri]|nr:hypothetical protein JX266_006035 [Neoarthrinium moseri]